MDQKLSENRTYYWKVRAKNGCGWGSWSSVWRFKTKCSKPDAPSLSSPSNGATDVSTSPTLDWSSVSGASSYDVQVCSDSSCSNVVVDQNVTSSQWTVSPSLNQGTTYYWRVRAKNSCGSGSWSSVWRFTTRQNQPNEYTLTVTKKGTGNGTVSSDPAGIDCGGSCSASFDEGTLVTLTATPEAGSVFAGWGGACSACGNSQSCPVTMDSDKSCTATFNQAPPNEYTLTVTKEGTGDGTVSSNPGGIDCGGSCSASFDEGTLVTLTATPEAGSVFVGWGGACSACGNSQSCPVMMDSDKSCTATFNQAPSNEYTLIVTKEGTGDGTVSSNPGGIDCGGSCSASFQKDSVVTLTATPKAGSVFDGWGGDCSGCAKNKTCPITMSSNKQCSATFSSEHGANPIAYYSFDSCDAHDDSGNGNDGNFNGSVGCVDGVSGKALHFDGNGGYVDLPDFFTHKYVTVCAWIKLEDSTQNQSIVNAWKDGESFHISYMFHRCVNNGGQLQNSFVFGVHPLKTDGSYEYEKHVCGSENVSINKWHFVCGSFDGTNIKIYEDGKLAGQWAYDGERWISAFFEGSPDLRLGLDRSGGSRFKGQLDELRIYKQALTEQEIFSLYKQYKSGLVLHYTFDSCKAHDDSGNGVDGKVHGEPQCVDGYAGKAFDFNGIDDFIEVNHVFTLKDFTVAVWFNTDYDLPNPIIYAGKGTRWGLKGFSIFMREGNNLEAGYRIIDDSGRCEMHARDLDLADGRWHLVVLVRDATGSGMSYLYVDGKKVAECADPDPGEQLVTDIPITIAHSYYFASGHKYFTGALDEIKIYDYALSEAEIRAMVQMQTLTVAKSGTGSGTVTSDPSGIDCGANCSASFQKDSVVTLTAQPDAGSVFDGWSGDCSGCGANTTCDITMNADKECNAQFETQQFTVTPSVGSGQGSISPSTPQTVSYGSQVQFTLMPDSCYQIDSVGGTCGGSLNGNIYTTNSVTKDCTVVAYFAVKTYTITASAGRGGSISPSGSVSVNCGGSKTFSITPDTGYHIKDVVVDGVSQGAISSYTFDNIISDHTINAVFEIDTYTLSVTKSGTGYGTVSSNPSGINCGSTCSGSFSSGTLVTLTATADAGSAFSGWSGDCSGCGTNRTCDITMNADKECNAQFEIQQFTVTPSVGSGQGSISPSTPQTVSYGSQVQFTLMPDSCYQIDSVGGTCGGSLNGNIYTTNSVTKDCTVVAYFAVKTYTITASAGRGGSISPSGSVSVNCGGSKTFSITPDTGYHIKDVVVDGVSQGAISSYTFDNIISDHTINAVFEIDTYTLSVTKSGTGYGTVSSNPSGINCGNTCSGSFSSGTLVTLTATADTGSAFSGWSGDCSDCGTNRTCDVTMDADKTCTAEFEDVTEQVFDDVPPGHWAFEFINSLYHRGITSGCGPNNYCPDSYVTRAQMAVFILKAMGEAPSATCTGNVFSDVNARTVGEGFCRYIEKFATLGITSGCKADDPSTPQNEAMYCPNDEITRAQMAVFITKALGEQPSASCTGWVFDDVNAWSVGDAFCRYIEKFSELGITSGCSSYPPLYCPYSSVTRAQMAVFLTRGFLQ